MADIDQVKSVLAKAEEVLVLLPQNPGPDSIASALSLHLSLQKSGKQSSIACGTPIDFTEYPLKQSEAITQKIGNKNLVVSLKVDDRDSIDKVSYNLDEESKVFNLIITPKKGAKPLSSDSVSYSLAGARADVIMIVGASGFDDLGSLYAAEPSLFTETPTVAINRMEPAPFALHHLSNPQSASIAESMVGIIESLSLTLDKDSATNLLAAIDVTTDKLQLPNVSAGTFDAVAKLIRAGGSRIMLAIPQEQVNEPAPAVEIQPQTVSIKPPTDDIVVGESIVPTTSEIPSDWLAPKIFKAPKGINK